MTKDNLRPNNVIPFPKLESRLMEKGRKFLEEGKVRQALPLLLQAKQMNGDNPETLSLLTAAYGQLGNFRQAKEAVERLLRLGVGDYFYTMDLYISILFQLNEYKKIRQMIKMLLDEHHIPYDKLDQYRELLRLCERMDRNRPAVEEQPGNDLFEGDFPEIIQRISELSGEDLFRHMDQIKDYLEGEDKDPFIKTVLLNQLQENETDEELCIKKYGREVAINPARYYPVRDVPFTKSVKETIEKTFFHQNPGFTEYALTLADRFFFNVYPLEKQFRDPALWSEAITTVVNQYVEGTRENGGSLIRKRENAEMDKAIRLILDVEENFNPGF